MEGWCVHYVNGIDMILSEQESQLLNQIPSDSYVCTESDPRPFYLSKFAILCIKSSTLNLYRQLLLYSNRILHETSA